MSRLVVTPELVIPTPPAQASRGQAVVETAIVLPVLLLLILSIYQLGIVYDKWQNLDSAAREGARAAVVAPPAQAQSTAVTAAKAAVAGQMNPPPSISFTTTSLAGSAADKVTACTPYSINILGVVVKSGTLCRDATLRVE
jgi:Flp pilus assembly protein TadG